MFSQYSRRTVSSISTGRSPTDVSARHLPAVLEMLGVLPPPVRDLIMTAVRSETALAEEAVG
ncbi:hypothetical protein ABT147_32865 [Streptomyces sp. NPDC001868]|uniref:hypothetical protein n=1 Tax=Streptomyces sp. NPDC001868 TaxID=3154401 RepID=UPI00331B5756